MGKVLDLSVIRSTKRKAWLKKNEARLEAYLISWLHNHSGMDFFRASTSYQTQALKNQEESWDYLSLRDILESGLEEITQPLMKEIKKETWFDPAVVSEEKIKERCLSLFISQSLE